MSTGLLQTAIGSTTQRVLSIPLVPIRALPAIGVSQTQGPLHSTSEISAIGYPRMESEAHGVDTLSSQKRKPLSTQMWWGYPREKIGAQK